MGLLVLKGKKAYSDFRLQNLRDKIKKNTAHDLKLSDIDADFVYFLDLKTEDAIDETTLKRSLELLNADAVFEKQLISGKHFFVSPRKGTISPWSSKATDIFHNAGLEDILRVERGIFFEVNLPLGLSLETILRFFYDRMTEGVYTKIDDTFLKPDPGALSYIDIKELGLDALKKANLDMGLALSPEELDYLYDVYRSMGRNPTDVELLMFAQVNSEHCRHKIFNAEWIIDGKKQQKSLFEMIKNTHRKNSRGTIVAYEDNSCVIEGFLDEYFEAQRDKNKQYVYKNTHIDIIAKVETHNHPTAISPFEGAATGVGGEIRDEGATGIGSNSKAGLNAFIVSNLRVPGFLMPWEKEYADFPRRLASPFEIMMEGPIGGASFGNEFGRPQLCGIFKSYEAEYNGRHIAYHKPIMLAGGMGKIKRVNVEKKKIDPKAYIVQIGGPAMKIGIGGGAASSMGTGTNDEDLDFNSVQRSNAEMQRRAQELIDACISMDDKNPILSIHDVGAGGLSNACPELVSDIGGDFWLRKIHSEDLSMSPMEIWCCEAQERYVLAVLAERLDELVKLCKRERCPIAVIGQANSDGRLSLHDEFFKTKPIDVDIANILKKPPRMLRDVSRLKQEHPPLNLDSINLSDAVLRVLRLPSVAKKSFLINIADRTVTGLVSRDQMLGAWQEPISDLAVTANSYKSYTGQAMAMGEKTSTALINTAASARMAVAEALTNIAGANIGDISNIKLSANWMCACGEEGEDAGLYEAVRAVGEELCPKLGISIPVGKDSLSMKTSWTDTASNEHKAISPLSLLVSAFSPVKDIRKTVTADIKPGLPSSLVLIDLAARKNRLSASCLAQVYEQVGDNPPDLDDPILFTRFFAAIQELVDKDLILAYHDRSDGGLIVTLLEMAFSARIGLSVDISKLGESYLAILFSEELGAVLQVLDGDIPKLNEVLSRHGLSEFSFKISSLKDDNNNKIDINFNGERIYSESMTSLNRSWSELSYMMQLHRDNPESAKQEYNRILDDKDPGLSFKLSYDPDETPSFSILKNKPKVAILREQGINGQTEMAAVFDKAGFKSFDVHMTDLIASEFNLKDFNGLVACGGFSYGDVLGAGSGWAKSILFNDKLRDMFTEFFQRADSFSLGICNGCQMLSQLKDIIPGADAWPRFTKNKSEQFEARYLTVEVLDSPSIFLKAMSGSILPIPVAHGEGYTDFSETGSLEKLKKQNLVSLRYVDNYSKPTEVYPLNPNGSPDGITGMTTKDGRVTIMMPHPERLFRSSQMSYRPSDMFKKEAGPWLRFFQNARTFIIN